MQVDWFPLQLEFDRWQDDGMTLPLWWRDDDAIEITAELDHLKRIADDHEFPLHLAIIPKHAKPELGDYLAKSQNLIPVVHGWAHTNHEPVGRKKAEFGASRPTDDCLKDAKMGLETLKAMLGVDPMPMFVPPWNRINASLAPDLADLGYTVLSTFTPRSDTYAAPNLIQINTHLDPIAWRSSRSLVDPELLIAEMVLLMQNRRLGHTDNAEPLGLLTHHLVHDAKIWQFIEQFFTFVLSGPIKPFRFS